jgi:hypothetical protein
MQLNRRNSGVTSAAVAATGESQRPVSRTILELLDFPKTTHDVSFVEPVPAYQRILTEGAGGKADYVLAHVKQCLGDEKPFKMIYLSLGGGDGSEIAWAMKQGGFDTGLLIEWMDYVAALNLLSAPGRLLLSTRKREVLMGLGTQDFCVDVLSLPEALIMLTNSAGVKDPTLLPPQATDVAQECGRLPLALAMISAMVQLRPTAWPDALEFLRSRYLEEFRRAFPDYPYPDLLRAIAVGVDELPAEDRKRYLDLAVFPEDEAIPEGPLRALWELTAAKTRACMDRLAARSLATVQQVGSKTALLLHDLQVAYIRKQRGKQLPALHTHLLDGYAARCIIRNLKCSQLTLRSQRRVLLPAPSLARQTSRLGQGVPLSSARFHLASCQEKCTSGQHHFTHLLLQV